MKALKKRAPGISIRWKLATYLAIFIVIVLLVTWVFQIYLLDTFYEHIKKKELVAVADSLIENIENEELKLIAYRHAVEGSMTVVICRFEDGWPDTVINMDATGRHGMVLSDDLVLGLSRLANEHGGNYLGRFFGPEEVGGNVESSANLGTKEAVQLMCLSTVQSESGASYLVMLNTGLQPVSSTVQILQTQFVWIAAILLICAVVMVILLYRHISAPLVAMNEAAKQLALGKYDVEFSGKGYRETRELAATLNYASCELSRLDHLQKELIANISHDLRTPLTMIKGYSEIMRDLPGENTPENMQVVIDEATRLSELVSDLLDLSRVQGGTRKSVPTVFDLTTALEETIHRYDTFVAHNGYHILVETDADVHVYADRGMILQVLYNLINNAVNYAGEDRTVRVTQTQHNGRVRISVIDTGEGIAPDQMPLIWDRYYKVDKVHRRVSIGTGLGLSITKEILELHHAAYGVDSSIGEGSTFWFELPICSANETVTLPQEEE